jgi:hypothetical protein
VYCGMHVLYIWIVCYAIPSYVIVCTVWYYVLCFGMLCHGMLWSVMHSMIWYGLIGYVTYGIVSDPSKGVCADPVNEGSILGKGGPGPQGGNKERQLSPDKGRERT